MKIPILFPIVIILLTLSFCSCDNDEDHLTPDPNPSDITSPAELTAVLNDVYDNADVPGFAISIIKDDVVLYQRSFGKADIENNKDYTNLTTQPIGSISKTFVAAAIVKAIEEGHLTLEMDINHILPVEVKNPKQPDAIIKVKHLVTHTSGLIDHNPSYFKAYHILPGEDMSTEGAELLNNGLGIPQRESMPLEDFLAEYYLEDGDSYAMDNFASTAPGSSWSYSNIATSLAAYLVEAATGIPFKEYVYTHILEPLGMTHTAYDISNLNSERLAKLYWGQDIALPNYANDSYPDGSINTCNEDMSKYLMDMMRGAQGQSTTLFSTAGYDMLFDALLPEGLTPPELGDNQGVFWVLQDGYINHTGSDPGTTCNLLFDANGSVGYALMTNMDASTEEHESAYFNLAAQVHDAFLEFVQNN